MPMIGMMANPTSIKARELYIGNLPEGVPEAQLMSFLNAALLQAGLNVSPGMPITAVRCNGRFAFAEFRSPEEASNAMNLNGIILVGHALSVGRPSAYTGSQTQHVRWEQLMGIKIQENPELQDTAIGLAGGGAIISGGGGASIGDPATKVQRELYIGNMPEGVNEMGLVGFFNQEMTGRAWNNPSMMGPSCMQARINGRFAFVEFRSIEETDRAMGLNGANYNGCSLRVGRPKAYQGPGGMGGGDPALMNAAGGMAGLARLGGDKPTEAIQMANMVTPDELGDDEEYNDILEDVQGEMEKYGPVIKLHIPRPTPGVPNDESVGLIFVKYEEASAAVKAHLELEGRTFGGNNVECAFYPIDKFDACEWVDIKKRKAEEKAAAEAGPQPGDIHELPANLLGGAAPVIDNAIEGAAP